MQNLLNHFIILAKQWIRAIILGVFICGVITFVVTTLMPRVYTAETVLVINFSESHQNYEGGPQSPLILPQIISRFVESDGVLQSVAVKHGLTTTQLKAMVNTKLQPNMPIIMINVDNNNAVLAAQLSYEVTNALVDYTKTKTETPLHFNIIKATVPVDPSRPRPLQDALLGGLIGLCLALGIVVISASNNLSISKANA